MGFFCGLSVRIHMLNFAKSMIKLVISLLRQRALRPSLLMIHNALLLVSKSGANLPRKQARIFLFLFVCLVLKGLGPSRQMIPFALFPQSNSLTVSRVFCICAKIFLLDCIQDITLETHPIPENPNRCIVITFLTKSRQWFPRFLSTNWLLFKIISLVYRVNSRTTWATQRKKPYLKKKNTNIFFRLRVCWHKFLIPALGRQKKVNLWA